jgi:alpha-glucuronidase
MRRSFGLRLVLPALGLLALPSVLHAETGHNLWLRYRPVTEAPLLAAYRAAATAIAAPAPSATGSVALAELQRGLEGLLGARVPTTPDVHADGAIVIGTPKSSRIVAALGWSQDLDRLGEEGYLIRSTRVGGHRATVIASRGDAGVLHGCFHLLRLVQTRQALDGLDVAERPRLSLRILDHWDNLDGSVERGYAGPSIWPWGDLPGRVRRTSSSTRANASIGINGSVLNNVNASAGSLTAPYLAKAAALADALRPYGIRVYAGQLRGPADHRRAPDRGPARPRRRALVEGQGRRGLRRHPRLRRVPGEGQQRRPARAPGLRP